MIPPSGQQHEIVHGDQRATIVEVGGGIREYVVGGRSVLHPYPVDRMCDGAHGAPLIPWPNRLEDGRYRFDDADHQVALTEPEKNNAIHGFLHWRPWELVEHRRDGVVMGATLFPLQGYPFMLQLRVEYRLSDQGLAVTTTATNLGDRAAPYGCGQHPYLLPARGSSTTAHCGSGPARGSSPTPSANCRPGPSRSRGRRTTSGRSGSWANSRSTSPSPTWTATRTAGRGSG